MTALTKSLGKLYKSYLFTVIVKDMKKFADTDFKKQARKAVRNIDFDKKYWLRKVGLTTYTPMRSTMSTGMLFLVGAALGAVCGIAMAPEKGSDFRMKMRERANGMLGREEMGETQAPAEA